MRTVIEINVYENVRADDEMRLLIWNIADLAALFSVIGALSKGVVQYADEQGLLA